jgi:hypothetical protein
MDDPHALARQLAQHLIDMGAAACEIPVIIEDERYVVAVRHEPVKPYQEPFDPSKLHE